MTGLTGASREWLILVFLLGSAFGLLAAVSLGLLNRPGIAGASTSPPLRADAPRQ